MTRHDGRVIAPMCFLDHVAPPHEHGEGDAGGANQEHGIMARRPGAGPDTLQLQVGQQVRILPNHACSTAAQYGAYQVVGADGAVTATWQRFSGW